MQRRMIAAAGDPDPVVFGADAGRLVDRKLLGDGQVERQVQERIDVAALGAPVAIDMRFRRFEQRMVFGMRGHDRCGHRLESGQRQPLAALAPRVDEKASGFVA
jgi:hypothetical protein